MDRPLIGITPDLHDDEQTVTLYAGFFDRLLALGAMPVVLPMTNNISELRSIAEKMDGVIFSGGGDIDPMLFGELPRSVSGPVSPKRDGMELPLARILHDEFKKPVLGICRGEQVLAVALGGTVYQDTESDFGGFTLAHRQKQPSRYPSHPVRVDKETLLWKLTEQENFMVNSCHHQAVKSVTAPMCVSAVAPDGVIEAVESQTHPFYLGLQWHPERTGEADKAGQAIFRGFVEACRE